MFHLIRQVIKRGMPVDFIVGGVEKGFGVFGGSVDMSRFDNPDTDAFVAAAIDVAGVFNRHLCVGGVQAAHVFVAQSLFRADKYFPEWPVFHTAKVAPFGVTVRVAHGLLQKNVLLPAFFRFGTIQKNDPFK